MFFLFGGVDMDFIFIHKYLENNDIDYIEFNKSIVENYLEFIVNNCIEKSKITILSVGLPVLDDDNLKNGLLNGHINYLEDKKINELKDELEKVNLPDIYSRTQIVINFNEQLKDEINRLNLSNLEFLDIASITYDETLKRIKDEYFTKVDHRNYVRNSAYSYIINNFIENS